MDFCNDIEEEAVFDYHESLNLKVFKIQQASKLFCSKSVNILKIQVLCMCDQCKKYCFTCELFKFIN